MHADADRDSFLARVKVYESWNVTSNKLGIYALFEVADATHHRVGV
jgi:hypothetical protein